MPKKSLGQNFLSNKKILSQIVDSGNISKGDVVLEIGPGTGNLTEKILEKEPGLLLAVEKDEKLYDIIKKKFGKSLVIKNNKQYF